MHIITFPSAGSTTKVLKLQQLRLKVLQKCKKVTAFTRNNPREKLTTEQKTGFHTKYAQLTFWRFFSCMRFSLVERCAPAFCMALRQIVGTEACFICRRKSE